MNKTEKRRNKRRKVTAEFFTPAKLVNEILDRLSIDSNNTVWEEDKTFVDPACGNGNFLIEVLKRKLDKGHNPLKALETIFGVDIMIDNINECRLRLIKTLAEYVKSHKLTKPDPIAVIKILKRNIKCTPLKNYPNGSLDYSFSFTDTTSDKEAQKTLDTLDRIRKAK